MYLLLAIVFHYLIIETIQLKEEPIEGTVISKNNKKGLYLYPRFEIIVEGSDSFSMVTKEQFESITIGNQVTGYMRAEEPFMTDKDIQMELLIGISISIFYIMF